jgi:hypothetical protein
VVGGRSPVAIGTQIDGTKIELELELVCQRVNLLRPVGLSYDRTTRHDLL